jgi:hypothetical protein
MRHFFAQRTGLPAWKKAPEQTAVFSFFEWA